MFGKLFSKVGKPVQHREIKLFNTESATAETFEPLRSPTVKMYTCGLTVYDNATIGNLRSFVFADVVKRTLVSNGYNVEHTINFTDFGHLSDDGDNGEDKMTRGLKRQGLPVTLEAMRELSDIYIDAFLDDAEALRIMAPTTWARASDYVRKQISLVKTLDDKGFIYETSDGWYFDVKQFPTYGRLGNINLDKIRAGARVETNSEKRHPADFAVWKKSDLGWQSRFGTGFPGWHMECSAMAMATLGKQIDIHTGGEDLASVHHNAEIAQSEAATGKTFVKYWLHSAFITIENNKIGKSLGNAITLRHLQDRGFTGDDYRYWLLTAHYRSPANFTWEALSGAKQALFRLKRYMYEDYKRKVATPDKAYLEKFHGHLANDFDTCGAITTLWEMIKDDSLKNDTKAGTLVAMDEILQIGLSEPVDEGVRQLGVISHDDIPEDVQTLIDEREVARIAQNWAEADRLRDAIKLKGYTIEDSGNGPKVSKT